MVTLQLNENIIHRLLARTIVYTVQLKQVGLQLKFISLVIPLFSAFFVRLKERDFYAHFTVAVGVRKYISVRLIL